MDEPIWHIASRGRCFVYLLACREEDTQKIGFARDPWQRMQAFHPRFHDFFDLGRGAVIETDRVLEARGIEARLKTLFAAERCSAPLVTRQRAGGKNEWFRGIDAMALAAMRGISEVSGYTLHAPLAPWLCAQWMRQSSVIRDWIQQRFETVEWLHFNAPAALADAPEQALRSRMEAWECIGLPRARVAGRSGNGFATVSTAEGWRDGKPDVQ